jgi:4-carboxymuconolactone decarboxylase
MTPRLPIPSRDDIPAIPTVAVLAHTPALAAPFLGWAAALALNGLLSRRDHELVALRAIYHCNSEFERVEHTRFARDAGLTDDEIARTEAGPDAPGWADHEAALLRAVDELHATCTITDATWAALRGHYEDGQLVEIPYVAGQYTMLSMVANGLGIDAASGA